MYFFSLWQQRLRFKNQDKKISWPNCSTVFSLLKPFFTSRILWRFDFFLHKHGLNCNVSTGPKIWLHKPNITPISDSNSSWYIADTQTVLEKAPEKPYPYTSSSAVVHCIMPSRHKVSHSKFPRTIRAYICATVNYSMLRKPWEAHPYVYFATPQLFLLAQLQVPKHKHAKAES